MCLGLRISVRAELGDKHSDLGFWGVWLSLPPPSAGAKEPSCKETVDEEVTRCLQPVVR